MNNKSLIRFVDLVQGSTEWKEFRKFKIGSSMAASIRGIGFRTPLQLFEDIMEDREIPDNEAMRRGREMEPVIRNWLNNEYGIELKPVVVQHPKYDWHISSLDGIWEEEGKPPMIVEIKYPGKIDHEMAMDGVVPPKYKAQCLHILEDIPQAEAVLYCSYHNEDSVAELLVYRDEEEMALQLKEEQNFYGNLLMCKPPEPTDKDWVEINESEVRRYSEEYKFLTDQISEMERQAESIKRSIIERVGNANRAKIGDLKVQKIIRQGAIDYSKIEALKSIDLNAYRKEPVVSWRLV